MQLTPILFSAPMVQALLDKRKTQTRRIIKDKSTLACISAGIMDGIENLCLYGKVGDVLWVKETFYAYGEWEPNGRTKTGKQKWTFKRHISVDISFVEPEFVRKNSYRKVGWYKRPSLFMERNMSRLQLEITEVRVQQLNSISDKDALAEGIEAFSKDGKITKYGLDGWNWSSVTQNNLPSMYYNPGNAFRKLWESINGEQSWIDNPYVWAITFKQVHIVY